MRILRGMIEKRPEPKPEEGTYSEEEIVKKPLDICLVIFPNRLYASLSRKGVM